MPLDKHWIAVYLGLINVDFNQKKQCISFHLSILYMDSCCHGSRINTYAIMSTKFTYHQPRLGYELANHASEASVQIRGRKISSRKREREKKKNKIHVKIKDGSSGIPRAGSPCVKISWIPRYRAERVQGLDLYGYLCRDLGLNR